MTFQSVIPICSVKCASVEFLLSKLCNLLTERAQRFVRMDLFVSLSPVLDFCNSDTFFCLFQRSFFRFATFLLLLYVTHVRVIYSNVLLYPPCAVCHMDTHIMFVLNLGRNLKCLLWCSRSPAGTNRAESLSDKHQIVKSLNQECDLISVSIVQPLLEQTCSGVGCLIYQSWAPLHFHCMCSACSILFAVHICSLILDNTAA